LPRLVLPDPVRRVPLAVVALELTVDRPDPLGPPVAAGRLDVAEGGAGAGLLTGARPHVLQ